MSTSALGLGGTAPAPHRLHSGERIWTEVNCYADLWIEVLNALGADPVPGLVYTLSAGFDADQWTFIKPFPQDLEAQYGLDVHELNPWRPVIDIVLEQLRRGHLLTVEVDSWYLPDTAGVSYRLEHVKTTIVPETIDPDSRTLGYFHGAGYHELVGEDFNGVLDTTGSHVLPPYVELVRRRSPAGRADTGDALLDATLTAAREHLRRRPSGNPVVEMGERITADLPWLAASGVATFHEYAFATCRQCGATAELAADLAEWFVAQGIDDAGKAVAPLREFAEGAKALQFALARAARGRTVDVGAQLARLAALWQESLDILDRAIGW